jgi:hypothetical protein
MSGRGINRYSPELLKTLHEGENNSEVLFGKFLLA